MTDPAATVLGRIRSGLDGLTRAERQLAQRIMEDYPAAGLGSLATLARGADVSVPTVARLVAKLGFPGHGAFQAALREEISAIGRGPIARADVWAADTGPGHILNRFTEAVIANIRATLAQIDAEAFDAACALVGDPERHLYIAGGRMTRTLAEYLFLHMQVIRPGVTHVSSTSNAWPHHLLDMRDGDVLVVFDVRRYETATLRLAELARAKGARVVLFTDQWRSPVCKLADIDLGAHIVVPSAWDSAAAPMLLLEVMIAAVQTADRDGTRARIEELEAMFDTTGLFRKFT